MAPSWRSVPSNPKSGSPLVSLVRCFLVWLSANDGRCLSEWPLTNKMGRKEKKKKAKQATPSRSVPHSDSPWNSLPWSARLPRRVRLCCPGGSVSGPSPAEHIKSEQGQIAGPVRGPAKKPRLRHLQTHLLAVWKPTCGACLCVFLFVWLVALCGLAKSG